MNIQTAILIITCSLLTLGCASKSKREFIWRTNSFDRGWIAT
ncbi:hypothetical protein [Acinetobacter sp.]